MNNVTRFFMMVFPPLRDFKVKSGDELVIKIKFKDGDYAEIPLRDVDDELFTKECAQAWTLADSMARERGQSRVENKNVTIFERWYKFRKFRGFWAGLRGFGYTGIVKGGAQ